MPKDTHVGKITIEMTEECKQKLTELMKQTEKTAKAISVLLNDKESFTCNEHPLKETLDVYNWCSMCKKYFSLKELTDYKNGYVCVSCALEKAGDKALKIKSLNIDIKQLLSKCSEGKKAYYNFLEELLKDLDGEC